MLVNKLGITDEASLELAEIELTQERIEQYEPNVNDISLPALQQIYRYLFQDIYGWAGELRTVDIAKGSTRFVNASRIEPEAKKLFQQRGQDDNLVGLPRDMLVGRLDHYYCELNVIHPFRDGNGRAQRLLFEVIAINAGYELHWEPIGGAEWRGANIAAYNCRLQSLTDLLDRAVTPI